MVIESKKCTEVQKAAPPGNVSTTPDAAERKAESAVETSSRNSKASSMPAERSRLRSQPRMPFFGLLRTSQMKFMADWSCANTAVAPKARVKRLTIPETLPSDG